MCPDVAPGAMAVPVRVGVVMVMPVRMSIGWRVIVGMVVRRRRDGIRRAAVRAVDLETDTGQHAILVGQNAAADRGCPRRRFGDGSLVLRKRRKQGCREHVAGDAAERVQMQMDHAAMMDRPSGLVHAASLADTAAVGHVRVMPIPQPSPPGRLAERFRASFAQPASGGRGSQRLRIAILFAGLLGGNLLAWGWALLAFGASPALLGSALIAWGFGLRHAVDADHIAAIDNVTRRLMQAGERPIAVGLFFSLGHSTVVLLAGLLIVLAQGWFRAHADLLAGWGAPLGAVVSAGFLLLIGGANCRVLLALLRQRRRVQGGEAIPDAALPLPQGGLSRLLRPLFRRVGTSRGMFWLGLLFGLGFDTATEIGVLGLAAAGVTHGQAGWTVMVFPVLFTAGMSLIDTADGVMMLGAYGWALAEPARKLGYNLAITAGSVLVAALVGSVEALDLAAGSGLSMPRWVGVLDTHGEIVGYLIVGGCAVLWLGSLLAWMPDRRPGLEQAP